MAMKGGNPQNLDPVRTKDEARKRGKAGGIASARARRERKSLRETAEILLKMPMKNGKIDDLNGIESLDEIISKGKDGKMTVNLTLQDMTMIATVRKAMDGDMRAMEILMDITGERENPPTTSPLDSLAEAIDKFKDDEDDE